MDAIMTWCLVSEAGSSGQIRVKGVDETAGSSSFSPRLHLRTFAPISAGWSVAPAAASLLLLSLIFSPVSFFFLFSSCCCLLLLLVSRDNPRPESLVNHPTERLLIQLARRTLWFPPPYSSATKRGAKKKKKKKKRAL